MVEFKAGSMVASMIVLFLAMVLVSKTTVAQGGQKKISAAIDIVFIVPFFYTSQMSVDDKEELDAIKQSYIRLAEFFEAGSGKARFAIVTPVASRESTDEDEIAEAILLNITHNFEVFKSTLAGWDQVAFTASKKWALSLFDCFEAMNTIIFDHKVKRTKIVVMVFTMALRVLDWADDLRKKDTRFYTIAKNNSYFPPGDVNIWAADLMGEAVKLVGAEKMAKRFFGYPGQKYTTKVLSDMMEKVKDAIVSDRCGWESICRYVDDKQEKCAFYAWQEEGKTKDEKICGPIKPTGTCSNDDCKNTCDERWPWVREPTCGCGKVEGRRAAGLAPSNMQYCPTAIVCPPCTTAPRVAEEVKEMKSNMRDVLVLGGIVAFIVIVFVIGVVIGIYFYVKKRNAKDKAAEDKMDAMMETMRHMSIRVVQPGAEAGLAADLMSERDSKMVPGGSKKPSVVKKETGGAKKTDSIKSGGKSASIKSGSLKK